MTRLQFLRYAKRVLLLFATQFSGFGVKENHVKSNPHKEIQIYNKKLIKQIFKQIFCTYQNNPKNNCYFFCTSNFFVYLCANIIHKNPKTMIKENKRNKKDNRQMLIARVEKIRPFVRNVCYVAKLKEAYPELEKIKSPKFHGVFTHGSLDENIIKKMECLFLPKKETV